MNPLATREDVERAVERAKQRLDAQLPGDEKRARSVLKSMQTRLATYNEREKTTT